MEKPSVVDYDTLRQKLEENPIIFTGKYPEELGSWKDNTSKTLGEL